MAQIQYGRLIVNSVLVAIGTAIVASLFNYVVALLGTSLGVFTGIVTALLVAGVFVFATNLRPGEESFTEALPVIVVSIALVELLRTFFPVIPSVVTEFTWNNLAILLSSLWLSDSFVKQYIKI